MQVSADRRARRWWALALPLISIAIGCAPAESRVAPPQRPAAAATETGSATAGDRATEDGGAGAAVPVVAVKPPAVATGDGRVREITFDDLKLPLEKGEPFNRGILPPAVDALQGHSVRIRGYILPSFQQRGITQFVLVRDNMECCFGPGALLHDCVVVRMRPGKSADFSIRPVAVAGSFRIEELKGPDGKHLAVYAIDGDAVE
jgi:hypothetical protein